MGKTKNATKPLTHEEIWDDSALVRSWDEAVEEYRIYHSIHAKGENVEDVLSVAENDDGELDQNEYMDAGEPVESAADESKQAAEPDNVPQFEGNGQVPGVGHVGAGPAPHAALGQVQDEGLKNLMMAWYYAGYYTGLYEGQQQASQNKGS